MGDARKFDNLIFTLNQENSQGLKEIELADQHLEALESRLKELQDEESRLIKENTDMLKMCELIEAQENECKAHSKSLTYSNQLLEEKEKLLTKELNEEIEKANASCKQMDQVYDHYKNMLEGYKTSVENFLSSREELKLNFEVRKKEVYSEELKKKVQDLEKDEGCGGEVVFEWQDEKAFYVELATKMLELLELQRRQEEKEKQEEMEKHEEMEKQEEMENLSKTFIESAVLDRADTTGRIEGMEENMDDAPTEASNVEAATRALQPLQDTSNNGNNAINRREDKPCYGDMKDGVDDSSFDDLENFVINPLKFFKKKIKNNNNNNNADNKENKCGQNKSMKTRLMGPAILDMFARKRIQNNNNDKNINNNDKNSNNNDKNNNNNGKNKNNNEKNNNNHLYNNNNNTFGVSGVDNTSNHTSTPIGNNTSTFVSRRVENSSRNNDGNNRSNEPIINNKSFVNSNNLNTFINSKNLNSFINSNNLNGFVNSNSNNNDFVGSSNKYNKSVKNDQKNSTNNNFIVNSTNNIINNSTCDKTVNDFTSDNNNFTNNANDSGNNANGSGNNANGSGNNANGSGNNDEVSDYRSNTSSHSIPPPFPLVRNNTTESASNKGAESVVSKVLSTPKRLVQETAENDNDLRKMSNHGAVVESKKMRMEKEGVLTPKKSACEEERPHKTPSTPSDFFVKPLPLSTHKTPAKAPQTENNFLFDFMSPASQPPSQSGTLIFSSHLQGDHPSHELFDGFSLFANEKEADAEAFSKFSLDNLETNDFKSSWSFGDGKFL